MVHFQRVKKDNSIKKYIVMLFVFGYLSFCTVALMVSPTTAYFTDSQSVTGVISASTKFEKEKVSDQSSKGSNDTVNNNDGKEIVSNTVEQKQDEPESETTDTNKKNNESPPVADDTKSNEEETKDNSSPTQEIPQNDEETSEKTVAPDKHDDTVTSNELNEKE